MTINEWNKQQDAAFFGFSKRVDRTVARVVKYTRAVSALRVSVVARKTGLPLADVASAMDRSSALIPIGAGKYEPANQESSTDCDALDFACLI